MRLAYALILHKNPRQFTRLVENIYHRDDFFALHVDSKASREVRQAASDLAAKHGNIQLVPSISVVWGGWGLLGAALAGFSTLLDMGAWDFAFNLSGQDYPLQPRGELVNYLEQRRGQSFIEIKELPEHERVRMDRLRYYHIETSRRVYRLPIRRRVPMTPFWGSNWVVLSREMAEYCVCDPGLHRARRFFRHTLLGEENFFQMAAMSSPMVSNVQPHNLHHIVWDCDAQGREPEHPRTFIMQDLPRILAVKDRFFARKFEDEKLLDEIDRHRLGHPETIKFT